MIKKVQLRDELKTAVNPPRKVIKLDKFKPIKNSVDTKILLEGTDEPISLNITEIS
jgi:hypothetical protein